ncbi:TIGR01777 family oxidoreductase [Mucilaginibacter puniceus]
MSKHILLTGGTGLLGKKLTNALFEKGYTVSHLSRKQGDDDRVKTYLWDIHKGTIDENCVDGVDTIIHLAGSGIADGRWTEERKKEIVESRTKSIGLIYGLLKSKPHQVNSVISASATGYYSDRGDELMYEDSTPAHDFLGTCCIEWEQAVDEGEQLGLRIVKFRTGVVLDKDGGALPQLAFPIKFAAGSPLGNGKQWIPWIHHQDVVAMYLYGIEHPDLKGAYNMVAPNPVTNKQLTKAVAKQLSRPLWLPNVPTFALKLLFGEMSIVVLGSTKVSAQKIEDAGFKFKYPDVTAALKEIYQ